MAGICLALKNGIGHRCFLLLFFELTCRIGSLPFHKSCKKRSFCKLITSTVLNDLLCVLLSSADAVLPNIGTFGFGAVAPTIMRRCSRPPEILSCPSDTSVCIPISHGHFFLLWANICLVFVSSSDTVLIMKSLGSEKSSATHCAMTAIQP